MFTVWVFLLIFLEHSPGYVNAIGGDYVRPAHGVVSVVDFLQDARVINRDTTKVFAERIDVGEVRSHILQHIESLEHKVLFFTVLQKGRD